jgi:hypothetical protein
MLEGRRKIGSGPVRLVVSFTPRLQPGVKATSKTETVSNGLEWAEWLSLERKPLKRLEKSGWKALPPG